MQLLDSADKRPPNVKVAASIRAAILTGEYEPGAQIPPGDELARFFGVSRMTVHNAVRTLRDEGFVLSRTGAGVFVRERAKLPEPSSEGHPLSGVATFLFEAGHLKRLERAGWLLPGVPQPETVAEHSFRAAVVGIALAELEGADVGRTAALCLMHDVHETRIGDVPSVGRAYVTTADPRAVSSHQTSAMPDDLGKVFQALVAEYEDTESVESQVAHDADKLETLLQAMEYQARGHNTAAWRDSSVASLRTEAGKQLAQAIGSADPHEWWSVFAASYRELRASTRGAQE